MTGGFEGFPYLAYLPPPELERVMPITKMAKCKAAFAIVQRPTVESFLFSMCETVVLLLV